METEPRVIKRDRKTHLSYELPHRIRCCQVCPVAAPNGSTLIVYGHDTGVKILWRGGRRRRTAPTSQANGVSGRQQVLVIDDSNDGRQDGTADAPADEYDSQEPEQDPDNPYSPIIHDLDLELNSATLHLAIPALPASRPPSLTKTHTLIAVACANGAVKLLSIPLAPPKDEEESSPGLFQIDLPALQQVPRCLSAKIIPHSEDDERAQTRSKSRGSPSEGEVLIAAASSTLDVYAVDVTATSIRKRRTASVCSLRLGCTASSVSFHPSARSSQVLISDVGGAVRIYELGEHGSASRESTGKWCMSYLAPCQGAPATHPGAARRKRILSCAWVMHGRGILALLEDGEWGLWDIFGQPQAGKRVEDFAISGFLGTTGEAAEPTRAKKPSKLAPMTPNTRKAKSDSLFSGSSRSSGAASGGISITVSHSKTGPADESLVIWYGGDIYTIPNMQQFWQRSTSNSGNFGSLYAPGMTHVADMELLNESISDVGQLASATQSSSFGQMNTPRDLVVAAEHRLVITESLRPSAPTRQLFQQTTERPASRDLDQQMLDAGDLDLGGLNRMLDSRAEDARPRRVGFAH